ncbi:tyrosine-type recombinase/integrase [Vreelandella alkaliphila]|uniref:tyrosine-type recombinase/integrase n=1 Tax=Vreelandella alkaliphila TaxID=272774 RepID=UPI00232CBF8B|nr:tyrosine-type recombinase/integrase [Halomonas alkaliphila]
MTNQLYRLVKNVRLPTFERFDMVTGEIFSNERIRPGYYSFIWPDGSPCLIAEIYLCDKSGTVAVNHKDGGTLGCYARNLSHLVRFCYAKSLDFIDLRHSHIDEFIYLLCQEKNAYNERVRNNNTVKSIVATAINFLVWIQENIVTDRLIAGVDQPDKRYQIKLKREVYAHKAGRQTVHNIFPMKIPRATRGDVKPISTASIRMLWDTLEASRSDAKVSRKIQGLFSSKQQAEHLEYMHRRRELQLVLLEATGLRPQELISMPCSDNVESLRKSQLVLPTLKGRIDAKLNMRKVPIPRSLAMKIEMFIFSYRKKLIERLLSCGLVDSEGAVDDVIYLNSENGKEVLPDAAYQEFRRLTERAGIKQKNCQKMFRHRFITNMVKLHFISFMDKNPLKTRHIITESDYRTILKKVASFTGHRSVDSLWHYIDLAWDELDAFTHSYEVKELQDRMKSVFFLANELKGDVQSISGKQLSYVTVEKLNAKLNQIEDLVANFRT